MTQMLRRSRNQRAIVQISPKQAAAGALDDSPMQVITLTSNIEGVDIWESHALIWTHNQANVFRLGPNGVQQEATFPSTKNAFLVIHQNYVFQRNDDGIKILSLQGHLEDTFLLDEYQGKATQFDACQNFFVAGTTNGYLQIWKMDETLGRKYIPSSCRKDKEAITAAIAIQLGLPEDAKQLYLKCKRYDLLNQLYQASGEWKLALGIASKHDRIHLKSTHHAYAKHLEALGDTKEAIQHYELSDTHRYEVPRMLYSLQKVKELEEYVNERRDPTLQRWWAHFCEANDLLPKAIDYYNSAGDIASLVRVYCFLDDLDSAAKVVASSSNASASFHLAQQFEKIGNIPQAIHFFAKSGKVGHAAVLAMKYGVDGELLSLSLQSTKQVMLSAAKYFEAKGMHEEAVLLFQKGGDLEKAIDVCARSQLFNALEAISDNLDDSTDLCLLERCGECLLQHQQFEKAIMILSAARQHRRALEIVWS